MQRKRFARYKAVRLDTNVPMTGSTPGLSNEVPIPVHNPTRKNVLSPPAG